MTTLREAVQLMDEGRLYSETWQRDWVWNRKQMTELLDSAYRRYKIGAALFWTRQVQESDNRTVILDGQQRMITLYTAFYNRPPELGDPLQRPEYRALLDSSEQQAATAAIMSRPAYIREQLRPERLARMRRGPR